MPTEEQLKQSIRTKVGEMAARLGRKTPFTDDDTLVTGGWLDSAGVLELLVWLETTLDTELDPGELSLENFGSVQKMTVFLRERGLVHGG